MSRPGAGPSLAGRRILALISEQQALDSVWEKEEDRASARYFELSEAINVIGKSITAQPIAAEPKAPPLCHDR